MLVTAVEIGWVMLTTILSAIWGTLFGDIEHLDKTLEGSTGTIADFFETAERDLAGFRDFLKRDLPVIRSTLETFFNWVFGPLKFALKIINAIIGAVIDLIYWLSTAKLREPITPGEVEMALNERYTRQAQERMAELDAERAGRGDGGTTGDSGQSISINVASMNVTSDADVQKVAKALYRITQDAQYAASYSGV
jgi:hypothetical protein